VTIRRHDAVHSVLTLQLLYGSSALAAFAQIVNPASSQPQQAAAASAPKLSAAANHPGAQSAGAAQTQSPPAPAANVQSLSLAAALANAQQRSFTGQQFDARFAGAAARLTGAGKLMNPVLSIGGHFGKNAAGTDEDYILSQTFELGDKRRQRVRAAAAEKDAASYDRMAASNDLVNSVKSAYFEAQRADAARQLAQAALDNAKKFAQSAEIQFTAGDVPRTQVTRSKIEQNRAEQALAVAETERSNRFAALRSLMHLPESQAFDLADPLAFVPVSYRLEDLLPYATAHRPDLQSAQKLRASKEAQLHGTRAQSQPDLFVEGRHSDIDPSTGGSTLRFGLLFPILDFGRNRADASSAKAAVTEQDAVIAETRRTALLEVETAFRNLQSARTAVESFRAGRLDSSKELLDLAQLGYSRGANTFLELLDAQQVYRNEQTDYTRALADYNVALAALERAVGGKLP
jgi:outer membrane protein TolC